MTVLSHWPTSIFGFNELPATIPVAKPDLEPFVLQILFGEIVADASEGLLNAGASEAVDFVSAAIIVGGTGLGDPALFVLPVIVRAIQRTVLWAVGTGRLPVLDGDPFGDGFFENGAVFIESGVDGGRDLVEGMAGAVVSIARIISSVLSNPVMAKFGNGDLLRIGMDFIDDNLGGAAAGFAGSALSSYLSK